MYYDCCDRIASQYRLQRLEFVKYSNRDVVRRMRKQLALTRHPCRRVEAKIVSAWCDLVEKFSIISLTYGIDVLLAISSVTKAVQLVMVRTWRAYGLIHVMTCPGLLNTTLDEDKILLG